MENQILFWHLRENFGKQNKESNLAIKLHYLEVMDMSLIFGQMYFAKIFWNSWILISALQLQITIQLIYFISETE